MTPPLRVLVWDRRAQRMEPLAETWLSEPEANQERQRLFGDDAVIVDTEEEQ